MGFFAFKKHYLKPKFCSGNFVNYKQLKGLPNELQQDHCPPKCLNKLIKATVNDFIGTYTLDVL